MTLIPYNLYNHILVNAKFHVLKLSNGFDIKFSFFEYVKSQMHFPLVVYLHNRSAEDYKDVYLGLTDPNMEMDSKSLEKVVRYFYKDISNSLVNIGVEGEFTLDLECLANFGLDYEELDGSFNEKILKLNKSSTSNDLILWR